MTIIILLASLCVYTIYARRRAAILSRCQALLTEELRLYKQRDEALWSVYLPIYRDQQLQASFRAFFAGRDLQGTRDRTQITNTLQSWMVGDPSIAWIVLYRESGSLILYAGSEILPAARLEEIRERLRGENTQDDKGYGLFGIARRFHVVYRGAARIDISSSAAAGTVIVLCIPCAPNELDTTAIR